MFRPLQSLPMEEFSSRGDRYDGLRACIGESMCLELHKLRVFMVRATPLFTACVLTVTEAWFIVITACVLTVTEAGS